MKFEKMFATEEQCLEYIKKIRYSNGYVCRKCQNRDYWVNNRGVLKCRKCRDEISVTSGTIFHNSKLPMILVFRALWWMVAQKNGVSATGLQRILGIGSYRTAWSWLHKFRSLMLYAEQEKLNGNVEVDDVFIGGKNSGKQVAVVIAIELSQKGTRRVKMAILPLKSEKAHINFILQNINKGSTLITDSRSVFKGLKNLGYDHCVESNKAVLDEKEILPNVYRVASLIRRWLLGTHQNFIGQQYLSNYLDEYTFRYNRRKSNNRGLLFYKLLEQGIIHQSIDYKSVKRM
ncbi:IS1595 family transposase [Marivirga sp. S37H4]|uniref:IS1595 family transposase n=1 Tax=Marivirga aurantiaca TaxID=2802615 RepID=A0A935C6T3_9BACT|nr:IS1595 family transposase [Marivirga aurantiaca]MBK6264550.1 IS1595 family transposase [Marivirga aurantiaca]